jgi:hypothetical protein
MPQTPWSSTLRSKNLPLTNYGVLKFTLLQKSSKTLATAFM